LISTIFNDINYYFYPQIMISSDQLFLSLFG